MSLMDVLKERFYSIDKFRIVQALSYLRKYGYLPAASENPLDIAQIIVAVKKFQDMFHLLVDGDVGPKTYTAMTRPRCACKDILEARSQPRKWGITHLTYFIERRDSDLSTQDYDSAVGYGFNVWANHTPLTFERVDRASAANFVVSTGSGRGDNFDGPGGTLAWAELPPSYNYTGQLLSRVDLGETWIVDLNKRGTHLPTVLAHEFGHFLGLDHSTAQGALMAPFYNPSVNDPQRVDDVPRIQALYGKSTGSPTPTPEPQPPTVLAAPTNLTATVYDYRVRLKWDDNSVGEDGFDIFRDGKYIGQAGKGWTTALDGDALTDGLYLYEIQAVKGEQKSSMVSVSIKVGDTTAPTPDPIPDPEPTPDQDEINITIRGIIDGITIPGYRIQKIG